MKQHACDKITRSFLFAVQHATRISLIIAKVVPWKFLRISPASFVRYSITAELLEKLKDEMSLGIGKLGTIELIRINQLLPTSDYSQYGNSHSPDVT